MKRGIYLIGCAMILILVGCNGNTPTPPVVIQPTVAEPAVVPTSDGNTEDNQNGAAATSTPVILNTVPAAEPTVAAPTSTPTPSEATLTAALPAPSLGALTFFDGRTGFESFEFYTVNEIFVSFDYANIPDQAKFRRDWYFNNTLFISREEIWNGAAYNRDGNRSDISIFDYESEAGLAPGNYQVELYLDDTLLMRDGFAIYQSNEQGQVQPSDPKFSGLHFKGIGPYSMEIGEQLEQPTEIFAQWGYSQMANGDVVRRDWYFNNELFITKEEVWDISVHGENGFRDDVSIFDYEIGLAIGIYRLELFVNGEFQESKAVEVVPFYVMAPLVEPVSGKSLTTFTNNTVVVTNPDGATQQISVAGRISAVDWFPGGEKIVIASRIVTDPSAPFPTFAHRNELRLWDLATNSLVDIGTQDDNYRSPLVSPDGNIIAVIAGTGYGDACGVDSLLVLLKMNGTNVAEKLTIEDFNFGSIDTEYGVWTVDTNPAYKAKQPADGFEYAYSPGSWVDNTTLLTTNGFGDCSDNYGQYRMNLNDLTATKVEQ